MLAEEKPKRGVLSIAEAQKLFTEVAFKTAWGSDPRLFTATLLAASTGMREGETRDTPFMQGLSSTASMTP